MIKRIKERYQSFFHFVNQPQSHLGLHNEKKVQRLLRECLDLIIATIQEVELKQKARQWEWDKALELYSQIWDKRLKPLFTPARRQGGELKFRIFPRTIHLDWGEYVYFRKRHLDEFKNFRFSDFFQAGSPIVKCKPVHLNHAFSLLALLSDSDAGISKLFRCENCGNYGLGVAGQKKKQRFCTYKSGRSACRVQWHYKQDPEKKKAQVRKWRKKNPGMG